MDREYITAVLIRCDRCGEKLGADARFCGVCGAKLVDPSLGRVIAQRYVLRERIGAGSLGVVYRAEQLGLHRKLAIKLLPADPHRDPRTVERFRREGAVLCRLRSPHTITTYEFDTEPDGTLYIAMEMSTGKSLADIHRDEGPLDWPRVMHMLVGLCDALAEAHELGVVHRDLKPENILVEVRPSDRNFVKLTDFGLAKVLPDHLHLSPPGKNIGSIEFSSPEQLLGRAIDPRADVYGLGVLAYLLVTGQHPMHDARTFGDLVAAHIHHVPPRATAIRADIPEDVSEILARCMEKDPTRRYPDAPALSATLRLLLGGLPANAGDTIREPDAITGDEDTMIAATPPKRP